MSALGRGRAGGNGYSGHPMVHFLDGVREGSDRSDGETVRNMALGLSTMLLRHEEQFRTSLTRARAHARTRNFCRLLCSAQISAFSYAAARACAARVL